MTKIHVEEKPGYHFMTDMTNQAIQWVQSQKSLTPQKPFFIYFAPGATHAPHHVAKEWIAKYKGQFDQGWDKLREQTLERLMPNAAHSRSDRTCFGNGWLAYSRIERRRRKA